MNKPPALIKRNQLLNRFVLDRETVEDQGRVAELCLNSQSHQVIGFICKSSIFSKKKKFFAWKQIDTVGTDAILVNRNLEPNKLEKSDNIVYIIGNEVWTNNGKKVGFIVEYLLNLKSGEIVNYLFKYNGWMGILGSIYLIPPESVSNAGSKRVIVAETSVQNPDIYTEGIGEKIGYLQNFLQADLERTREHIVLAKREAKKLAVGFQERVEIVKEQAQEKAQVVAEQAKQKVEEFQGVSGEKRRKNQSNSDEFYSKIQQVTTQAKEKIDGVKSQWKNPSNTEKDDQEKDRDNLPIQP